MNIFNAHMQEVPIHKVTSEEFYVNKFNREHWQSVLNECLANQAIPSGTQTGRFSCEKPLLTQVKKEENMAKNIILSAEGLAAFVRDLQEMTTQTIYKRDDRGNRVMDEMGDYVVVDVDVADRWVNFGDIKVNDEGKFVVKVSDTTLNNMEAHNARKTRIAEYEAK